MASEQLTVKAAYQQTTHVTLQSISDEKIFKMCDNYLGTDQSLEKFKSKCWDFIKQGIYYWFFSFIFFI